MSGRYFKDARYARATGNKKCMFSTRNRRTPWNIFGKPLKNWKMTMTMSMSGMLQSSLYDRYSTRSTSQKGTKQRKLTFHMPSSTFLATQCITVDGTYANIHHIPPIVAKLQYSFRLRAACKLMALRLEISVDDDFFM